MEYLHVLSRPMVINHDHDIIWTEAYMDSRVSMMMAPGGRGGPELRGRARGQERSIACLHRRSREGWRKLSMPSFP